MAKHPNVVQEEFPPYAPDANPDEWVWSWAKNSKLCNYCPRDVDELYEAVLRTLDELKHRRSILASFVMEAGVPLSL